MVDIELIFKYVFYYLKEKQKFNVEDKFLDDIEIQADLKNIPLLKNIEGVMSTIPLAIQLINWFWCMHAILMSENNNDEENYIEEAYRRYLRFKFIKRIS